MEQASWLLSNYEQISVVFLLIVGLWYVHNELKLFKKLHTEELNDMRKSHREERDAANAAIAKALSDIAAEIKIANQERSDIKHLLESTKDFQVMITNSLHNYDNMFAKINATLGIVGEKCEPKFYNDRPPSFPVPSISRAEERERARSRERIREYDRDN